VVAASVLLGGLWTYHTFNAELHVENARATLRKLELEAQRSASVKVQLEAKVLGSSKGSASYVEVLADLRNSGTATTVLNISNDPVQVARVIVLDGKWATVGGVVSSKAYGVSNVLTHAVLRVSEEKELPFLVEVPGPGLYLAQFVAEGTDADIAVAKGAGAPSDAPVRWVGYRYFVVEK